MCVCVCMLVDGQAGRRRLVCKMDADVHESDGQFLEDVVFVFSSFLD